MDLRGENKENSSKTISINYSQPSLFQAWDSFGFISSYSWVYDHLWVGEAVLLIVAGHFRVLGIAWL